MHQNIQAQYFLLVNAAAYFFANPLPVGGFCQCALAELQASLTDVPCLGEGPNGRGWKQGQVKFLLLGRDSL